MDDPKIKNLTTCQLILFLILGLFSSVGAQDWLTITSFSEGRRMRVIDSELYITTTGGLLAVTDPLKPGREFTNLDGLGTVDISDIIKDASGQIWVTGFGRLVKFNDQGSVRYPMISSDGNKFNLYTATDDNDNLWLGADLGLILFSKSTDGGQIQDSYQLFGDLNTAPDVFDILLIGDTIFLATSSGLALADKSSPVSLKNQTNWIVYGLGSYPELGTDTVRNLINFESSMYLGTANGLFRLDRLADTLIKLPYAQSQQIRDLQVIADTMFVYTDIGIAIVKDSQITALAYTGLSGGITTGNKLGSNHWVAAADGGIYYQSASLFEEYPFIGLPHNDVVDITVIEDGLLTVLLRDGPYELNNDQWLKRSISVGNGALIMRTDIYGYNWVGTFGGAIYRIGDSIVKYDTSNSTLTGISPGSNAIVTAGLTTVDNLIISSSFRTSSGSPIALADLKRVDSLSGWINFGTSDGILDAEIKSIDYFEGGMAIGSGLTGVYYYWMGADPFNKSDDRVRLMDRSNNALISNNVQVLRFAPGGELWVGTNFGLSVFTLDFGFFDQLARFFDINLPANFGPSIFDIEFDSRGNVWLGSDNGVARIDGLDNSITVYNSDNSGLVNDKVINITFDITTGDLYFATPGGLSVLKSSIVNPTEILDSVYAFPNPFIIGSPADQLNFNLAQNAQLRIFSVAGELVKTVPQPRWDGTNQSGEGVASGVYIFLLTDDNGELGRGKILLIRQ